MLTNLNCRPIQALVSYVYISTGDRPQGVAGDCNSLAETHAWFDSRVAHHFTKKVNEIKGRVLHEGKIRP